MNCDICGGTLSMQMGSKAVCSVCGMEYSLESLKEKAKQTNSAPRTVAAPVSTNLTDNQLRMAEVAIRQKDYSQAVSICDTILTQDYYNLSAWKMKICAFASSSDRDLIKAADCFKEAYSLIQEQAKREQFIVDVQPSFMEKVYFNSGTATIARNLMLIDVKMASKYLQKVIDQQISYIRNSYNEVMNTLKEYSIEAQSDLRWHALMGQTWNHPHFALKQCLEDADAIWKNCGEQCYIEDHLQDLAAVVKRTAQKAQSYLPSRNDLTILISQAEELMKKIQEKAKKERKIAVQKYWANHTEIKEQLESQRKALQKEISDLQNSSNPSKISQLLEELTEERDQIWAKLHYLGLFEIRKKKELKEQMYLKEAEIDEIRKQLINEDREIENKVKRITDKIAEIDHKIENPPM